MLSPSKLYPYDSKYFFYTSDKRFFSIYFVNYTTELEENGEVISRDFIMFGFNKIKDIPKEFSKEYLSVSSVDTPSKEINSALKLAIINYFAANEETPLIYILSTEKSQHEARKRRFTSFVDELSSEITIINYEFPDPNIPDSGFMVLTKNKNIDNLNNYFNKYIRQLYLIINQ